MDGLGFYSVTHVPNRTAMVGSRPHSVMRPCVWTAVLCLRWACTAGGTAPAGSGRPMPPWPYLAPSGHGGTPGLAWFGANETGFENEHQLSTVFQNYSMVVFGWQALLTAPANYSRELSLLVEQCQIVKKTLTSQGYPDTPVIVYCDNLRVQPFYGALSKIMRDPEYQDFFLRAPGLNTSQGEAGYIPATTYCTQMHQQPYDPKCLCWYWNLFNESAVEYYLNELLLPQAKLPGFDGVFFVSCSAYNTS
eukprot:COSAG02_NODE_2690_length_8228_cov_10.450732_2_plen_249_part_00